MNSNASKLPLLNLILSPISKCVTITALHSKKQVKPESRTGLIHLKLFELSARRIELDV